MGVFDSVKKAFQNHLDKKKEEQEMMDRIRKEAQMQKRQIFEEEMRKNSSVVAIAQAKKDAAKKSGLQKLRAENRLRNLNRQQGSPAPGSFFDRLREHTQKNLARRDENLKRTAEMKEVVKKIKEDKIKTPLRKPFGQASTWRM